MRSATRKACDGAAVVRQHDGVVVVAAGPVGATEPPIPTIDATADAGAGEGLRLFDGESRVEFAEGVRDRMTMPALERRGDGQRVVLRQRGIDDSRVDQSRPTFGQRAGLVGDDVVDARRTRQRLRTGHDHAVFRQHRVRCGQAGGQGQREGARAGGGEYGQHRRHRARCVGLQPIESGQCGDGEHRQRETRGDALPEFGAARLLVQAAADARTQLAEPGRGADGDDLQQQRRVERDAAGQHGVAGRAFAPAQLRRSAATRRLGRSPTAGVHRPAPIRRSARGCVRPGAVR
jgi:hypothetical protein